MTDPTPAGGYTLAESFESDRVTAVSSDESRVVVGAETGDLNVVTAEGRTTIAFDAPITDLAVGNRVYALVDDTVSALSTAGTRVWSVELPGARRLAALPGPGMVGVVTDDELLGFDGETGGQEFAVERPYADVTDDPGFFGTEGAYVLVAWSFLAVRNLDGTERFESNLGGAIESTGIVDDTIVVSLKDERVVGIHAKTGQKQWERELSVVDLPDHGDDALLFSADDRLVSLSADGTYATVDDLPEGEMYPTSDGSLFCTIADGTVGVYCASGDPAESLSISIADDELVTGVTEAIDFEVRNEGDRPVEATIRVTAEGIVLAETDWSVDFGPGESAARTLGVEEVEAGDAATVTVEADGDRLGSVPLSVADRPNGSLATDASLVAVDDGDPTVEVINEGEATLTDVSISPGGDELGRLEPSETTTVTLDAELARGGTVPVSVRSDDDEADLEVTLPAEEIAVGVETAPGGFIDVRVENGAEARLADDLVIEGNCFDARHERRVELPERGLLVFALRPDVHADEVRVEATLAGLGIGGSAQFDSDEVAVVAGRTADGNVETSASATPKSPTTGTTGGLLSAERTVETTDLDRTQAVSERISVVNEGNETAEKVMLDHPDGATSVGEIPPDNCVTSERRHAFMETGEVTLPAVTVTAADAPDAHVAEEMLTITPAEFAVEAELDAVDDGYEFRVELTNRRDVPCEIDRIGVREIGIWDASDCRVPPGRTVEWTRQVGLDEFDRATIQTVVEYTFVDAESNRMATLGRVNDDSIADAGLAGLTARIGEETRVSGGYGSVVLVVDNQSGSSVSDVSIEAASDDVSNLMYGGRESVEKLAPSDQFTHFVDIETERSDATISVVLSTDEDEAELTLAGPAPSDEEGWSDDTLDAWSVEWDGGDNEDASSAHVTTEFELT